MCINPACAAPELISLVPFNYDPNSDLISEPHILKEPLLVNGYTSVFSVTGKVCDPDKSPANLANANKRQNIKYKVLPNSHVHVTNTVIIDTEKDILRKIEENDPLTIKKLLDSQKMSAAKRLNTFIESLLKNGNMNTGKIIRKPVTNPNLNSSINESKAILTPPNKKSKPNIPVVSTANNSLGPPKIQFLPAKNSKQPTPPVQNESIVKSAVHPTLKITSVTSMNEASSSQLKGVPGASQIPLVQSTNAISTLPMISSVQSGGSPATLVRQPVFSDLEKNEFKKMREEITELKELLKQIGGNVRRHE